MPPQVTSPISSTGFKYLFGLSYYEFANAAHAEVPICLNQVLLAEHCPRHESCQAFWIHTKDL